MPALIGKALKRLTPPNSFATTSFECWHKLSQGLAIGVGYAGNEGIKANALAIGISIQRCPEAFVVAIALLVIGYSLGFSVLVCMVSCLADPLGAVSAD